MRNILYKRLCEGSHEKVVVEIKSFKKKSQRPDTIINYLGIDIS
jgi:hypothetical protein